MSYKPLEALTIHCDFCGKEVYALGWKNHVKEHDEEMRQKHE